MSNNEMFTQVLSYTRMYFVREYHGGTREMVYRYVAGKMGDVPPKFVSAALKVMNLENRITYEKKVWWFLRD